MRRLTLEQHLENNSEAIQSDAIEYAIEYRCDFAIALEDVRSNYAEEFYMDKETRARGR